MLDVEQTSEAIHFYDRILTTKAILSLYENMQRKRELTLKSRQVQDLQTLRLQQRYLSHWLTRASKRIKLKNKEYRASVFR